MDRSVAFNNVLREGTRKTIIKREHKLDLTVHPSVMEMFLLCFTFFSLFYINMSLLLILFQLNNVLALLYDTCHNCKRTKPLSQISVENWPRIHCITSPHIMLQQPLILHLDNSQQQLNVPN